MLRRPLSYQYSEPCFYAVFPFVENNLVQWLKKTPSRDPKVLRDLFMQTLTIMRCMRTRQYYYCDIKPSNFVVLEREGAAPRIEISDLGGIVQYGDNNITISPGQLPDDMKKNLSWTNLDAALSMLLGEMLLQMLMKTPRADDSNPPVANFFACIQKQKKEVCEKELLKTVKRDLAVGISIDDALSLDLVCVAFMLMGFGGRHIDWQEVHTLASPINSI
jgi:serine/threonine protein kinase